MAHPGDKVAEAGAGVPSHHIAGMPQIVKVEAGQTDVCHRFSPPAGPLEARATQSSTGGTDEDEASGVSLATPSTFRRRSRRIAAGMVRAAVSATRFALASKRRRRGVATVIPCRRGPMGRSRGDES
jgi:hypothetical protein